jgi:aminoglycoside 3-N-acetyltransferase
MYTKEDILTQLKKLGVPKDKPVIVHVSLKKVGATEGRAQGLLDALIEHVTEKGGTLAVPTHTWSNFYEGKTPVLDMTSNFSCIATFPKIALADGRGQRTLNPTHSLCLFGDRAKEFCQKEEEVDTPTSPLGAYGEIMKDGYVLLLGVGQEKNTLLHCVEEFLGIRKRLSKERASMPIKTKDGKQSVKDFYYMVSDEIEDVSVFFPKYEVAFRKYGGIKDGYIGNAKAQLCDAKIMKEVMSLVYSRSGGIEILSDDKTLNTEWYE